MGLGGSIKRGEQKVETRLLLTYSGGLRFDSTCWKHCRHRVWALDYINQGQQQQRICRGKAFTRLSSVAALYAPGCDYYERQITGAVVDSSYIMFEVRGEAEALLRQLTGERGWCHFRDPDHFMGASLRRVAELVFYRRPGFHLLTYGAMLELLGMLVTALTVSANLREVRVQGAEARRDDLIGAVERFIGDHIAEPLSVADLARHVKMSASAFAHAYPRLTDESPYQTVRRLKLEAAKRLLLQDRVSVKECAERLGFSSEFHFSRLFKQLEGISPMHYRHALMEKEIGAASSGRQATRASQPRARPARPKRSGK